VRGIKTQMERKKKKKGGVRARGHPIKGSRKQQCCKRKSREKDEGRRYRMVKAKNLKGRVEPHSRR